MKIRETGSRAEHSTLSTEKLQKALKGNASIQFEDVLEENRYKSLEEELADIVNAIGEQGKRLGERLNLKELITYKNMISSFLNKAVEGIYNLKKEGSFDRWGRHNIYAVIKNVDTKLESLTKEVMQEEKDRLAVLGHVDEIRGMLMDLFL